MSNPFDDMSDAEIAKLARKVGKAIDGVYGEDGVEAKTGMVAAAGLILIRHAVATRSGRVSMTLNETVIDGEDTGDWTITVGRKDAKPEKLGPEEDVADPAELEDGRVIAGFSYSKDLDSGVVTRMKRRGPLN